MEVRKTAFGRKEHFARRRIDQAQFRAGREFRKHHGMACCGQGAAAEKWLAKCRVELGEDGLALVHDALIRSMTTKQIMESRGRTRPEWERYFTKRVRECLSTLVEVYGFATRGKENSRLWRQNANHWRAVARPEWDALLVKPCWGL